MTGRYRERFPIAISEIQESRLADQIFGISLSGRSSYSSTPALSSFLRMGGSDAIRVRACGKTLSTPYEGMITAGYDGGLAGAPLRPGSADAVDGDRLGIEAGHGGVARLRSDRSLATPPVGRERRSRARLRQT